MARAKKADKECDIGHVQLEMDLVCASVKPALVLAVGDGAAAPASDGRAAPTAASAPAPAQPERPAGKVQIVESGKPTKRAPGRRRPRAKAVSPAAAAAQDDLDRRMIEEFLRNKGVTKCPPRYAQGSIPSVNWNLDGF